MALPPGWTAPRIGDVAHLQLGKMLDKVKNTEGRAMPYLRNINVRWFRLDLEDLLEMRFTESEAEKFEIQDGDVLVCEGGEPGRAAVWRGGSTAIKFQKAIHRIRPSDSILSDWITFFLRSAANDGTLQQHFTGTTIKHLPAQALGSIEIPVPPLAEQRRIVARIEALFARTRRARADLERVAPLSKRYREACTERAYEGDAASGWPRMPLGYLADVKSGLTLGKRYAADTVLVERPYLRVANVQRGHLKLDEVKTIRLPPAEAERLTLQPGDVLMNEGGDRDKLGRGWFWQGEVPDCIHQNHVFRVRLRDGRISPRFLSRYANHFGQRYFLDEGKQTTNLASISMSKVAALPVPLPPPGMAAVVDAALDRAEQTERSVIQEAKRSLALLDRLEQSILAKAFRGELVPQNPSDEPAESLLTRLADLDRSPARKPRALRGRAA